jgi:hypothetical protein
MLRSQLGNGPEWHERETLTLQHAHSRCTHKSLGWTNFWARRKGCRLAT